MRMRLIHSLSAIFAVVPAGASAHEPARMNGVTIVRGPAPMWHAAPGPDVRHWGGNGSWGRSVHPPVRGFILPGFWLGPRYVVSNWAGYGFSEPGMGRRWVRYYDDAVLVDDRGMIYDSVRDVPWGRYSRGPVPVYVGDQRDAPPSHGASYDYGYDDAVTWDGGRASTNEIWAWPGQATNAQPGAVVIVPPGATTTIVLQPQPVTTTTTITYYEDAAPAWKASPRSKTAPRSYSKPRVIRRVPVKKG